MLRNYNFSRDYNFGIVSSFKRKFTSSLSFITRVLYPHKCHICSELLLDEDGLCPRCWHDINFIDAPMCDVMGIPFTYDPGEGILSAEALADLHYFNKLRAVAHFDNNAKKLIQMLKYHDRLPLSKIMARMMVRAGKDILTDTDIIIPVPLFILRLWSRQFNQSQLLAKEIARLTKTENQANILIRTKNTISQVGLSVTERQKNVSDAFKLNKQFISYIKGKKIILIDDVYTTGATSNACSKVLLNKGAREVNILVFARVVYPTKLPV